MYVRMGCIDICMDSGDILCPCTKIGGGHKNIYLDIPPTLCYRSYLYFLELHLECSKPANIKRARLP